MSKGSKEYIKREITEYRLLLRSIPAVVVTLFVVSVVSMNLLANKTLLQLDWIALDGGILISWLSFMCMDIITKHFGPKASNSITLLAAMINLLTCLIFFVASAIPSNAGDYAVFDTIFGGTWFILLGSTVAFLFSALINNTLNFAIGKAFRKTPDGRLAYAARTYISTFIGQFLGHCIYALCADLLERLLLVSPPMRDVRPDGGSGRADHGDRFLSDRLPYHAALAERVGRQGIS